MKYIRKQSLNPSKVLDNTVSQSADGNIGLNPTQRAVLRGDLDIIGNLTVSGAVPSLEVTNVMYVTQDGNDENNGMGEGPDRAKRSIKAAVEAAQQGTTIFVRSGEYQEYNPIRIPPKVSLVGDNLRRVIVRPLNGPVSFNITNIERTNTIVTITTSAPHGLTEENRIRIRCSNDDVDETDANIVSTPTPTTLTYRKVGANIASQAASGVIKYAPDLFLVNSQNYITGMVFKGLQAPAYCVNIDDDAIVDTSPYVQNCSNINGPWMRNGVEWLPFITQQPNLEGEMVSGPRPLLDDEIDPTQVDVYGIDIEGAGGGMLIDGDRYNSLSPIKSMVGDAFTQVAQGGVGFHVTNFGYMQLVSCFAVFCSKAFYTTRGGYLSISNSVIDFGTEGFVTDGYYPEPYATANVSPDFYSTAGSVTVNTEGSGFTVAPTVVIDPPDLLIPGARQATAEASIDPILGTLNAISITDPGFGYDFQPLITITPANGATATVNLSKNLTIDIVEVSSKPQVGSIMFLGDDPVGYYISATSAAAQPFTYDEQKCSRDVALIVNAVLADMVFGSNYRSTNAGLSYLRSYSSKVTSLQKLQTIAGLEEAKILTLALTSDVAAQTIISSNFDIVIDIITDGLVALPAITMPAPATVEAGYAEAADILEANKLFIQDEITAWLANEYSFVYDEAKCSRDVGLILEAVLGDMVLGTNHQSRAAGLAYIRSYASTVTSDQREQTVAGINRAKEIAISLITDQTNRNIIIANFEIVTDIIINLGNNAIPLLTLTDPFNTNQGIIDGAAVIQANKTFLQAEVVAWINEQIEIGTGIWEDFVYNSTTCSRDIGYVVDALTFDLLYNGNSQSKNAGEAYYAGVSYIPGQEFQTVAAFNYLKSIIDEVVQNTEITATTGNLETQNTDLDPGSVTAAERLEDLIDIIVDIVTDGTTTTVTELPLYENGALYSFKNPDRQTILDEKSTIQTTVIEFLNEEYSANFTYNEATCRRDIAYIVDALRYDLTYGGNSQTRDAAASYAEGSVIVGEIEETQAAYEHWRDIVIDIVQNISITPSVGNTTSQDTSIATGSPVDPTAPAAKISTLLKIIIDTIDHGPGYIPEIPTDPDYEEYGDEDLLIERDLILTDLGDIQADTISYLNDSYGGSITVTVFPPVQTAVNGVIARFHNVSTLSSGATAMEYVGAGVTYNALPFFGGEPDPEKERVETNNGKAFTVTSDQVGNYRIGEFFTVNALTGEVTINAENLNLSGLASIGPFRRNGIPVGVQLREVSDNTALISSIGTQDFNTVPTQRAVGTYVENRYLNKVQSSTPQTIESNVAFIRDVEIRGGDLTTNQNTFNLLNTTATTVNFAGAATTLEIGAATGTTEINNNLNIVGSALTVSASTFNLANTNATTVNFAGAATDIQIGAATGTTEINNNLNIVGDVEIDGGDLTVSTSTFNLVNTNATTLNFAGAATTITVGAATGTTTVRNALQVDLSTTLGNSLDRITTVNGSLITNLKDNTATILDIKEGSSSYIKIDTTNSFELVTFGTAPKVAILNTTDSSTKDNGALVVEGGVGIEKSLTVGGALKVDGSTTLGNDRNTDTLTSSGISNFDVPDDQSNVFEIRENLSSYFKVITLDSLEAIEFGTSPKIRILNSTDSVDKNTGALVIEGGAGIERSLTVGVDITVNRDVIIDRDLAVNGGDITTTATTASVFNTAATTVNIAGDATLVNIGSVTGNTLINNDLTVYGDATIAGADDSSSGNLYTSATLFNLIDTVATTVNFAGAATAIDIGAVTGTMTLNNPTIVGSQTVQSLFNTVATTVNFAGAATTINVGAATGTLTLNNATVTTPGQIVSTRANNVADASGQIYLNGATGNRIDWNLAGIGAPSKVTRSIGTKLTLYPSVGGDPDWLDYGIGVENGFVWFSTARLIDGFKWYAGSTIAAATLSGGGTLTLLGDISVNGGVITTNQTSFNLLNTTATTINFGGAATTIEIGAATGTTNINNSLDVDGDVNIDGGDLTVSTSTFNLANTTASTVNFAGAGTTISIGAATGTTTINNANTAITGDLAVNGGDLTTSAATFNLLNTTATTVNFAGAATSIEIGAATGTTNINNSLDVDGDVNIDGGDLTVSTATFNLANTTATTVNFAGAGTTISIGAATGTTTINNTNTVVTGDLAVNGGDITTSATTATVFNANATTLNVGQAATTVSIGAATGTTTINNANTVVTGDLAVNGGDITTSATTFNLLGTNVTTGNLFAIAPAINIATTAAIASTLRFGPTISGNVIEINSITSGTVSLTSDVTTGIANVFSNITTGSVNIATAGASTVNVGGTGSTTNISTLALTNDLAVQYGGTGVGTFTTNGVVFGNGTGALQVTAASLPGSNASTSYGILTTDVNNVPVWTDVIDEGEY